MAAVTYESGGLGPEAGVKALQKEILFITHVWTRIVKIRLHLESNSGEEHRL